MDRYGSKWLELARRGTQPSADHTRSRPFSLSEFPTWLCRPLSLPCVPQKTSGGEASLWWSSPDPAPGVSWAPSGLLTCRVGDSRVCQPPVVCHKLELGLLFPVFLAHVMLLSHDRVIESRVAEAAELVRVCHLSVLVRG